MTDHILNPNVSRRDLLKMMAAAAAFPSVPAGTLGAAAGAVLPAAMFGVKIQSLHTLVSTLLSSTKVAANSLGKDRKGMGSFIGIMTNALGQMKTLDARYKELEDSPFWDDIRQRMEKRNALRIDVLLNEFEASPELLGNNHGYWIKQLVRSMAIDNYAHRNRSLNEVTEFLDYSAAKVKDRLQEYERIVQQDERELSAQYGLTKENFETLNRLMSSSFWNGSVKDWITETGQSILINSKEALSYRNRLGGISYSDVETAAYTQMQTVFEGQFPELKGMLGKGPHYADVLDRMMIDSMSRRSHPWPSYERMLNVIEKLGPKSREAVKDLEQEVRRVLDLTKERELEAERKREATNKEYASFLERTRARRSEQPHYPHDDISR